jgi:hypothetical protein
MDIAFAAVPSDSGLTEDDILRFQRLALVLQACKRRAPFSSCVFPSDGAPYRAILRYVASLVQQSSGVHGYTFQSGESRQNTGPWLETLKMKPDGKVGIYINVDVHPDAHALPSWDEVEKYYEACRRENPLTRSEKRRKQKRGGMDASQELSMA